MCAAKIQINLRIRSEEILDPWLAIACQSQTLVRLRGCTGRSETSVDARANLYHLLDNDSKDFSAVEMGFHVYL